MSSSPSTKLDSRRLEAIRRAWDRLLPTQRAVPIGELVRFGRSRVDGHSVTLDLESARALGCPVVIVAPTATCSAALEGLSRREREVARLMAKGYRNVDIASELGISIATVKDHVHHVLTKTGMESRTQLAAALAHDNL